MSEELEKLLRENLEISRESLKILKGIRRSNRFSAAFKAFYWLIILGSLIGVYYYLQPYIKAIMASFEQMLEAFSSIQKTGDALKGTGNQGISPDILKNIPPDILKNLQNILKTQ